MSCRLKKPFVINDCLQHTREGCAFFCPNFSARRRKFPNGLLSAAFLLHCLTSPLIIVSVKQKVTKDKYLKPSLDMVRRSFADWSNEEEADLVVRLIKETRSMSTYIPELELIMVNDEDEVIGYALFSGFHLGGKYRDELLLLSPVAVKIEWQRQHISKEIIEYGFEKNPDLHTAPKR